MRKVRVYGETTVCVWTTVEIKDGEELTEAEILGRATENFTGIHQLVGNGGCGDKLIGVDGDNTISADSMVDFLRVENY